MTHKERERELKPCPFCGSSHLHSGDNNFYVWCLDCGAVGPHAEYKKGNAAWNARASLAQPVAPNPLSIPEVHALVREAGGIVHSDGNIFFTNAERFIVAAVLCGERAVLAPQPAAGVEPKKCSKKDRSFPGMSEPVCNFPQCGGSAPCLASAPSTTPRKEDGELPALLFDGYYVYSEGLTEQARKRTSPDNVADVLDAVVRLLRGGQQGEGSGHVGSSACGGPNTDAQEVPRG